MESTQAVEIPNAQSIESQLAPALEEVNQKLIRLNETALEFVRARPVACVVGAVALGFIVGRIAARYSP